MSKDKKQYRILVIEDNPGDFVIVEDLLTDQIVMPVITQAINYKEAFNIIKAGRDFDIILLDLSLPDKAGEQLVTEILEISSLCCPVIILTGYTDIDFSIRSISKGISDYLLKDELNAEMLYKSIIYAIERRESFSQLKKSEKRYSDLFNLSPQPMWVFDAESFRFVQVNKSALKLYGYSEEEFFNIKLSDIETEEDIAGLQKAIKGEEADKRVTRHYKKSKEIIEVETYSTPIAIQNKILRSVIVIDITERKKAEAALKLMTQKIQHQKIQEQKKITRAILGAQETERNYIGRELHDNITQILAGTKMYLGIAGSKNAAVKEANKYPRELIDSAIEELRLLSSKMVTPHGDINLQELVEVLLGRLQQATTIKTELVYNVAQVTFANDLTLNIYRIIQEQLNNITKYAEAKNVRISITAANHDIAITVTDDGKGFDVKKKRTGIGISNMINRVESFNGKAVIKSAAGKGSKIEIHIPC